MAVSVKTKVKVVMVFSSLFDGMGICHNVFNYCKYLNGDEFELVFVMINEPTPYFKRIIEENQYCYYVLPMRNKKQFTYIKELAQILKKEKADILHAHGNSATLALEMIAGKLAKTPVRISHSRNSGCQHQRADKILRPVFSRSYTAGLAVSKEAGEWLFPGKKYTVLKNANDIKKFEYNEQKRRDWRERQQLGDAVAIGHVGTFNERKNQKFVVEIFDELCRRGGREYKLYFVGEGKLEQDVQAQVKERGLEEKVFFLGIRDDMEDFLQAMDIMLLPSYFEGLPNTLIEWQAACLPSVVSDTVTMEAKLTELPRYMPLAEGAQKWADEVDAISIIDRDQVKEKVHEQIRTAGFDVRTNAKQLEGIYYRELGK